VNKALVIGIIIAVAIAIGAISVIQNNNLLGTNNPAVTVGKSLNTTTKHYTMELKESVGVSQHP
jgi:uncharacterized protein YxeA